MSKTRREREHEVQDQQAQQDAAQSTIRHIGPTAERYAGALERYVLAVSAESAPPPRPVDLPHRFPPMTVADVMTRSIVCAYPAAQFKEIAQALHRNGINAVPVIDEDRHVVGVVTASDLLTRLEQTHSVAHVYRTGKYEQRHKLHAATARDLMTSPAITTTPGASLGEAARLISRARVRSLPVVDRHGVLVAMVSRADLIEVFLRSDDDIRRDVESDVVCKSTEPGHGNVHISVAEGVVTLSGRTPTAMIARGLAYRAAQVPGVVDVRDELEWDVNDLYVPTRH